MNAKATKGTYVIAETPDILGRMEAAVAAMRSARQARADRRSEAAAARTAYTHRLLTAAPALLLLLTAASLDAALFALIA